jgi:hypothetical protein
MEGLIAFERAVLDKLLTGDHPVLIALRAQARKATVASREYTGAGFFCSFEVPPDAPLVNGRPNFHFGDVDATMGGLQRGAGFVLFVRNGRLDLLEGYSYDEPWPREIRNFELTYQKDPRKLDLPD